jgi:hypothetical protein
LLVGPNNAGKSVALRDIIAQIQVAPHSRPPTRVVTELQIAREGSAQDFEEWLQASAFSVERPDGVGGNVLHYQRPSANTTWNALKNEWERQADYFPAAAPFFVFYAAAEQRLGLVGQAGSYDAMSDVPNQPLQVLFANPTLRSRFRRLVTRPSESHLLWRGSGVAISASTSGKLARQSRCRQPADTSMPYGQCRFFRSKATGCAASWG